MFISTFRLHHFSIATVSLCLLLLNSSSAVTTNAQARVYITNRCNDAITTINTDTNAVGTIALGFDPGGINITPDGARLYLTNSAANTVVVIDTATDTVVATIPAGLNPFGVATAPDGAHVYVTNSVSQTISVIDTQTNTIVDTISVGQPPSGIAITPDGTRLYVVTSRTSTITVFDTTTNTIVATIPVRFQAFGVVFAPDGTRAYVEQANEFFTVIDTTTNTVIIDLLQALVFHDHMAITPDGARLYATSPLLTNFSLIDTSTTALIATDPLGFRPTFPAITSDGTCVYIANVENTVSVVDTLTNTSIATIAVPVNIPDIGCLGRIVITPVPKGKDDCKDGGYRNFRGLGFTNQGQCIKYVNRHAN